MAAPYTLTTATMSQAYGGEQQQRSRYLALKARMDELTAGTEWTMHRGKGVSLLIAHIQARPHQPCCRHFALDVTNEPHQMRDRQHEEFATPETFDDNSSDLSSDSSDESSLPSSARSNDSRLAAPDHDSSASSPIIYLSATHSEEGTAVTPPPGIGHRTPSSRHVHQSPAFHTPATDTSSSSTSDSTSSSASSHSFNSSLSEGAAFTNRRSRSRHRSHCPVTPVSTSIDYHRQTLSVYWPWTDDDSTVGDSSNTVMRVQSSDPDPAVNQQQPPESDEITAEQCPYVEQIDAAPAEETEPGMPAAKQSTAIEQPGAPWSPSAEAASEDGSADEHYTTEVEHVNKSIDELTQHCDADEGASERQRGSSSPQAWENVECEEDEEAQQQFNDTSSSFAVAAAEEPSNCADAESPHMPRDAEAGVAEVKEGEEHQESHVDSPMVPSRRTAARRRVLVSDDEDESDAACEPAAQSREQRLGVDVAAAEAGEPVNLSHEDSPAIVVRGGNARRRQIVSDDDNDVEADAHTARPPSLLSPLRDITNQPPPTARPLTQPFASPLHKPHPASSFIFATPAPRLPTARLQAASHFTHAVDGGRQTRTATRSAMRRGRVACDEEEDEMDLYATPMIERIRQHKAALYNKQTEEDAEDDQEEAEDQDEYDRSFIVSEDEDGGHNEDSYVHDDDSDEQSPRPSARPPSQPQLLTSTKRPPPPSAARGCPALTKHNRVQLARDVYTNFNHVAFTDRLPADLPIEWCNKLTTTAGHCRLLRGVVRGCVITLAVKVIDSYERLRKTLAHEMCHAAAWLIDGCNRPPHGRTFRHYAQLCERRLPSLSISTCHTYAIYYPWRYRCSSPHCGQEVGRHTDSLDVDASRCGRCGGRLVRLGKFARDGTPVAVREVKGFAAFVKAQQARVRAENPGTPQRAVMGLLSAEWKRQRAAVTSVGSLSEEEAEQEVREEDQLVQRMLDLDIVEE